MLLPRLYKNINFNDHFKQILPELTHYHNNVKKHYAAYQQTKASWEKVIKGLEKGRREGRLYTLRN